MVVCAGGLFQHILKALFRFRRWTLMKVRMASTFKYVRDDYPDSMGVVSGVVGIVGGLGGFLLPIMFGALLDRLGVSSSCFMLLYGIVSVSLALNYLTEVRRAPVMGKLVAAADAT
jgi:NNP family nitrate/nitrite transporter-like MFS transporter